MLEKSATHWNFTTTATKGEHIVVEAEMKEPEGSEKTGHRLISAMPDFYGKIILLQEKRPDEANCAGVHQHRRKAVEREDTDTQQGKATKEREQKTLCGAVMDCPGFAAGGVFS